jgi:hypothetical protein
MRDSAGQLYTVSIISVVLNADIEVPLPGLPDTDLNSWNQSIRRATREHPPIATTRTVHTKLPGVLTTQSLIAMDIVAHWEGKPWALFSTMNCPRNVADQD